MSRTYRKQLELKSDAYGRLWSWEEEKALRKEEGLPWGLHLTTVEVLNRRARDKKPWDKPTKGFKQMKRRIERAKTNHAVRMEKEVPEFRKTDRWEWT